MEKIKKEKEAEDAAKLTGKPDMYVLAPGRACVEQHTDARMYNHLTLHCCSCSVASSRSTTQKSHKADKKNVDQMYAEAENQKKMYPGRVCMCVYARVCAVHDKCNGGAKCVRVRMVGPCLLL